MVFKKGHKPYLKKKSEGDKMFGKKKVESVKTFVDGQQVDNQTQSPPPTPQPQFEGRYVEANMQLSRLPATLLLKIEVYGDIIPLVLKIDEEGNVG